MHKLTVGPVYRGSEFMSTITFIWMVIQLQRTVIPSSLYLNGPPIWFCPQTRKVKPTLYSKIRKVLLSGLQFNDPHTRFVSHTLKQNDDFLNWGVSLGICSIICLHPKLQKDCNYRTDILSIWNDAHSVWHETLNLVSGNMWFSAVLCCITTSSIPLTHRPLIFIFL